MGDLEAALNLHYILVDFRNARFQHILLIASSLLIFSSYGVFLWILCSISPSVLSSLLLLGTQIGLGLPMARAYYDFGVSARNELYFFDPGLSFNDEETIDLRVNIGDIPLLFERMELQIQKYDQSKFDDLTDLSWFLVLVWAIMSSGAYYVKFLIQPLCAFGVLILLSACIMCYASGYWTKRGFSFEEDLEHLEYYIDTLVKTLDSNLPNVNGPFIIQVKHRRHNSILIDFAAEFVLGDSLTLKYHFGLSSKLKERFILGGSDEIIESVFEQLGKEQSIFDSGWELKRNKTQSGLVIEIVNPASKLSLADRTSFVTSPFIVEQKSLAMREIFSIIVHTIKGLH
ncbi:MAG: hypothetical protein OEV85_11610 [Candidatus Thorarchaeota archaeon]|nr:hypothetical protein [Candidatus Thorarchaeota archaeon]